MHIRSRRRITLAALAGVLAIGGTGLTVGAARAQLESDDPDYSAFEEETGPSTSSFLPNATATEPPADGDSEEITIADDPEDTEEAPEDTDSTPSELDDAEPVDPSTDVADLEEASEEPDAEEEEQGQTALTVQEEQARCPFTKVFNSSVKQMLIKREGGVQKKAYNAGEKTKTGKDRGIVTIGIGFNMSRGDARTIINRILSETTPEKDQAAINSGKAFHRQRQHHGRPGHGRRPDPAHLPVTWPCRSPAPPQPPPFIQLHGPRQSRHTQSS
ncbi:hypothetical protein [Nonomuraea sp. NPDC049784]|uniref:hypothetical protein n=1 Tax=Nonomuraea sp. NPDC049784 TaxID=3154361 RepID=UPI00340CB636